jgi:hypothetical protein
MRIVNLRAENFKRLSAVDITPGSGAVVLSGANEQGKSSVLDAIMAAIAGGRGMKDIPEPVRRGAESAEVSLDLGDIKVRRQWDADGKSKIEVTNADGAKFSSPQGMLDSLAGILAFDPLEFARMPPRDQRATLLRLGRLPFDIDENDRQRAALVQAESNARQELKRMEQAAARLPEVPEGTPDAEISAAGIYDELTRMGGIAATNREKRQGSEMARMALSQKSDEASSALEKVTVLERELAQAREKYDCLLKEQEALASKSSSLASEADALTDPDPSALEAQLATLDETNKNVRQKKANASAAGALEAAKTAAEAAKEAVAAHDRARADALAAAEFPVGGLGFSEDGVTLGGLAFAQASESQRIMASAAMGMAMNPKLRVMFVRDGSALDSKRMAALTEMAASQDFQLWVEKVDESGSVGIVIEDGRVKDA